MSSPVPPAYLHPLKPSVKPTGQPVMDAPVKCRIGLTGGIGCGKSTVATLFQERGASIIDADALSRALTAPQGLALPAIRHEFGAPAIGSDGAMNRDWIRSLVFSDLSAKARLEAILHPMIRQQTEQAIADATGPYLILDIPLLFEFKGWRERVREAIAVDCPESTQIARVQSRGTLNEAQILAIMKQQVSRQVRRQEADHIVDNSGPIDALQAQVEALHQRFLGMVCYS
jgi:dephospho-CoA kinase